MKTVKMFFRNLIIWSLVRNLTEDEFAETLQVVSGLYSEKHGVN